ncbi:hypothetical protein MT997_13950 [Paenibacillus sp. OVF10]|nr:hypothetical protein MT997_13950 [Paenibacillus sp. OVF10]
MSMKIIVIVVLVSCFIIAVSLISELSRYNKLKKDIESHFKKEDLKNTPALLKAYNNFYSKDQRKFKEAYLTLKTSKEAVTKETIFEDLLKMVISLIPLIALLATLAATTFKDYLTYLLPIFDGVINSISVFFALIIVLTLNSRISVSLHSKTSLLISKHLIIAEDVIKNPPIINNKKSTRRK